MPKASPATNARCGCLRGGGPTGVIGRTRTTAGVSETTWAGPSTTAPPAGPAAREARLRPAGLVTGSGVSLTYACLGSNIRSTHVSAGLTLSMPSA